jgi:hypothetical protein
MGNSFICRILMTTTSDVKQRHPQSLISPYFSKTGAKTPAQVIEKSRFGPRGQPQGRRIFPIWVLPQDLWNRPVDWRWPGSHSENIDFAPCVLSSGTEIKDLRVERPLL